MIDTWYGTLLISEYGITVLILMVMVHVMVTLLHGGYTCFMIGFMLCAVQIIVFLNIVSAKLLSMIYKYLGFGKVGFCEMFAKQGTLQKSGSEVLREGFFEKQKHYFLYKLYHSLRFISHGYCFNSVP